MPPKKEEDNIFHEYFSLVDRHVQSLGSDTVVLYQCGSFFEIYGYEKNGELHGSKIVDVSRICELNCAKKQFSYKSMPLYMSGFRDYMLEQYVQIIINAGYNAVVYVQEKSDTGKGFIRTHLATYSAGTYLSMDTITGGIHSSNMSNNTVCIWIETKKPLFGKHKEIMICGISSINVLNGKTSMFEFSTGFHMNPTTFDELERFASATSPSEVILLTPFEEDVNMKILQFAGLSGTKMIHIKSNDTGCGNIKTDNCRKQSYMKHLLSTHYGEESISICNEFSMYPMATQSFVYLLDFVHEHNPSLVKNIDIPHFSNTSDRMVLANHTLKQLNIIDDRSGNSAGILSSVSGFLNKCKTTMGKRKMQSQIVNPTFDSTWLNAEYEITDYLLLEYNVDMVDNFRKILGSVCDIEKLQRQLIQGRVLPHSIYELYHSVKGIQQINMCMYENSKLLKYLCNEETTFDDIEHICIGLVAFLDANLDISKCVNLKSLTTFEENIIKTGVSEELDNIVNQRDVARVQYTAFKDKMNDLMKSNSFDSTEYVKDHETEKGGQSLLITKTRGMNLKNELQSLAKKMQFIEITERDKVQVTDIKVKPATSKNYDEISCVFIDKICSTLLELKTRINEHVKIGYAHFLFQLQSIWGSKIHVLSEYISKLDVILNKVHVAVKYKYCKPVIDNESNKSYAKAKQLRHCLIEHIQTNELYVANDVSIGTDGQSGMLLYGTNAVGKTSIIRALGISVIMAQSGMYVPCESFTYSPYKSIFTRILGNDNLFKGLSTFAVEMSELRVILNYADKNSLVLGDELCSGTETESALSIFVAGILDLNEKDASFIFATHFHEIVGYDEIKSMNGLKICHMSVVYDSVNDCLVYDRKLKEGAGTRMYGLEVCKSLYLPPAFMDKAYSIRNKYHPDVVGGLSHVTTTYNAKKVRGMCEMCKTEIGEETHHLLEQNMADTNGFIGHVHKNHPANLMSLCEKCHLKMHHAVDDNSNSSIVATKVAKKIVKKKTTKGYVLSEMA